MHNIHPCLWFDTQAEEAARFYTSVFKNSRIISVSYYGEGMPMPAGTVLVVSFELNGQRIMALNGGPAFTFNEAISLVVPCETQSEIDELYARLSTVPAAEQCGWLKDKYGLSWQIIPAELSKWLTQGDSAQTQRVMHALMPMKKLDIATLARAYNGG